MKEHKITWGVSEVAIGAEQSVLLSQFGDSSKPITFYSERDVDNLLKHKLGYTMALSANSNIVSNEIYVTYSIDMKQVGQSILIALIAIGTAFSFYKAMSIGQFREPVLRLGT